MRRLVPDLADALLVLGLLCVPLGLALVHGPTALVVFGGECIAGSLLITMNRGGR